MGTSIFLDIAAIPGESKDPSNQGKIDVSGWSWGLSQSAAAHSSAGGGSGKATVKELTLFKSLDNASAPLMICVLNGRHLPSATLIVTRAAGLVLRITMTDVLVTSVTTTEQGSSDQVGETVTLAFGKVSFEYFMPSGQGSPVAGTHFGFDIDANRLA